MWNWLSQRQKLSVAVKDEVHDRSKGNLRVTPNENGFLTLFVEDDLFQRANNLVYLQGIRGYTESAVLGAMEVLRTYATLDGQLIKSADEYPKIMSDAYLKGYLGQ